MYGLQSFITEVVSVNVVQSSTRWNNRKCKRVTSAARIVFIETQFSRVLIAAQPPSRPAQPPSRPRICITKK
jgi:hypothetical protein